MSLLRYDPLFLENAGDRALARGENVFDAPVPRLDGWRVPSLDFGTETTMALVRGSEHSSVVAITIDDGPHPVTTSLMLKILAEYQAKATFFVVGEAIMHYPQLLLDIVEAGHEVGNHCFTNRRLPSLPPSVAAAELGETSKLIEGLGRQRCRIMRPPGGDLDEKTLRLCTQMGLLPIFWSRNTGDWQPRPASDIARAALSNVKAGDIILLHQGRLESALALREIIAGLRQMGLQPGRVCDLFPNAPLVSGSPASVIAQLHTAGCLRDE
jgi:peptidoglycan/xylan/chitin deacetylase (PgdA/CDA1 family)